MAAASVQALVASSNWSRAAAAIVHAREQLDALGRSEAASPGDRERVSRALLAVRQALSSAAGSLEEAHGLSRRVDLEQLGR